RRAQGFVERQEAAVEYRNLGAVDIDEQIVQPERGSRRKDMLHGMDPGLAHGERRTTLRRDDVLQCGPDFRFALQIHPPTPDPRVRGRRPEPDSRRFTRVQADPFALGLATDRLLVGYGHSSGVSRPKSARSRARMRLTIEGSLKSAACARSASLWGRAGYPL